MFTRVIPGGLQHVSFCFFIQADERLNYFYKLGIEA